MSAAIRFSVAGWVVNNPSMARPDRGLMMNSGAVAGLISAVSLGMRAAPPAIFSSAEASHSGLPQISAPLRSA
jgi:hypothetical protein